MADKIIKEAFNEQVGFFEMLATKLKLAFTNLHNDECIRCFAIYYEHARYQNQTINFLNKELGEYIKTGKLNNWVNLNINNKSIEDMVDISFFWSNFCGNASYLGEILPTGWTDDEVATFDSIHCYSQEHSIVDFHESNHYVNNDCDDGHTVFHYDGSRRIM